MFDDDWGLESKEVSPLGKELSLFDRPNEEERVKILEAHRLEHIIQQLIFQHVTPSHNDGFVDEGEPDDLEEVHIDRDGMGRLCELVYFRDASYVA
ncbi:hypothetical protein Tco_1058758 [Tanacetum coccineum]|uniref:Uncharacterized protein n=1 Tax=Tanacetum coccineum TaxID=301880 RepID=A0ABQ5HAI1_9ASTR